MKEKPEVDMALMALIAVAKVEAPDLPEDLVHMAFAIEKRHQFDSGEQSNASVQDMQTLIDEFVETQLVPK